MAYGWHADLAHMHFDELIVRSDVACTIFLVPPESYKGGELAIKLPVGELRVSSLPATPSSTRRPRCTVSSRSQRARAEWP